MSRTPEEISEPAPKKKVDESWKESVHKEKETPVPPRKDAQEPLPEHNFAFFVSTLGMQVLAALGELKEPGASETSVDLRQAQSLIDILQMLSEKTRGKLSPEENELLENLLYELRMKYVQKSQTA